MESVLIKEENIALLESKGLMPSDATPTQSMVQKLLRDQFGINIFMTFKPNIKKWDFFPYDMALNAREYIQANKEYGRKILDRRYDSYEDALEVGITEGLLMTKTK